MQKRLVVAAALADERRQAIGELDALEAVEVIEREYGALHARHGRLRTRRRRARQLQEVRCRPAQPGREGPEIRRRQRPPVKPLLNYEPEEELQVVRVRA
jgi:hypothetical protein